MNEQYSQKEETPFQIGDLVTLRKQQYKLRKFWNYPENDVAIVIDVKKKCSYWLVEIYWQKHTLRKGKCLLKHHRLKKVRIKNAE